MRRALFLALAGAAVFAAQAAAQIRDHAEICFAGTGKFELDISFCSLAIQSKKHRGPGLATLYAHRGRAKSELGDLSGAIVDFETALAHNPASALALNERGRARHKQGDNDGAVVDYGAALALNPRYGAAYRNRGTAQIHLGQLESAIADLDRAASAVNYDPASCILRGIARHLVGEHDAAVPDLSAALTQAYPYPEAVLWLYLAERGAGREAGKNLSSNAEAMSDGGWPDALIEVYLGERAPQSALAAAEHPREDINRRRLTQARFFLGALAIVEGDAAAAHRHLEAAVAFEAFDAIERAASQILLRKLAR